MKESSIFKGLVSLCLAVWCSVSVALTEVPSEVPRAWLSAPAVEASALDSFWAIEAKTLPADNPGTKSLADFKGKPLLVNFWATWCAPCVREMPLLDSFAKENPQLPVVGLALDSLTNMQKFESKVKVDYPLLQLEAKQLKLVKQLGNSKGGLPFTVLFDEAGKIKAVYTGELHKEQLSEILGLL